MMTRFIQTKSFNGMKYLKGISNHAKILLGATYENRASFLTIEIVLIANKNLRHKLAKIMRT